MTLMFANYTNDNSSFTIAPSIPRVTDALETDSKNILLWLKYNGLKANPDKFHLLLSKTDQNVSVKVEKFEFSNTVSEKLLGVAIDNKLTFKPHVTNLCKKASQKLHALSRVSNYMNLKQKMVIIHSIILSQFGYCPLVWMLHGRLLNSGIDRIHEGPYG